MKIRRSFGWRRAARRIEVLAGLWLAAGLWGSAVSAVAAGVPPWLREAAKASLPNYPDETTAVVLLDEQERTVNESGEVRIVHRRACKILRPEGRREGNATVVLRNNIRLVSMHAWGITADGLEHEAKEKDAVEHGGLTGTLYDDIRTKTLPIPGADPGNVVGYEYELREQPFVLQDKWFFQEDIPVRLARYTLQLPSGWEHKATWVNHPPQEARSVGGNRWVWEVENIPGIKAEPEMPPWRAVAGWLGISYLGQGSAREKSVSSWNEAGKWQARVAQGQRQASPEIKEKVTQLTSSHPTLREKIRALATFVQREIRYVAVEIGIGGFQPHPAPDIFANRYGDCKDKATLLSTMLKEIGVESFYVIVHIRRGVVAPQFPSPLSFNHVILAIRLPQDAPTDNWYALYRHSALGTLLIFDPTSELVPLGDLPSQEQGGHGLLVTNDGGELIELPLLPPTLNRLLRTAKLTLTPDGTIEADVKEIRWGAPATGLRAQLRDASPTDRRKRLEEILSASVGDFFLRNPNIEGLDDPEAALTVTYHFVAGNYAKKVGDLLLVRPRIIGSKGSEVMEEKERKYPVEFPYLSLQSDIYEISLPPGFQVDELPLPAETNCAAAEYKSKVEVSGDALRYTRAYAVKNLRVPVDRLGELKTFYRRVGADERSSVVLKRAIP